MTKRSWIGAALMAATLAAGCSSTPATDETSPEQMSSILTEAGIPPEPEPAVWRAYIADLAAIDPDIVHGDEEEAVDNGRNQCSSVHSSPNDEAKLIDLTNQRFTSPTHQYGFGKDKAAKILAVVRKHLCP